MNIKSRQSVFLYPVINNAETLAVPAAKLEAILAPFSVGF
jgi:hypothetical protein